MWERIACCMCAHLYGQGLHVARHRSPAIVSKSAVTWLFYKNANYVICWHCVSIKDKMWILLQYAPTGTASGFSKNLWPSLQRWWLLCVNLVKVCYQCSCVIFQTPRGSLLCELHTQHLKRNFSFSIPFLLNLCWYYIYSPKSSRFRFEIDFVLSSPSYITQTITLNSIDFILPKIMSPLFFWPWSKLLFEM